MVSAKKPDLALLGTADLYLWQALHQYLIKNQFDKLFIADMQRMAIASSYALRQLVKQPTWLMALVGLEDLSFGDFPRIMNANESVDMVWVKRKLRQYRHLKLVQIIYLDVIKRLPQRDILRRLSDLADLLIAQALNVCEKQLADKYGQPMYADNTPMRLNVVAMGKLGGRELNFSSDIDLIGCYANDGNLSGYARLSYHEFFTRVVRLFTQCLHEKTEDEFVYRVDLRLRPWGESGPIVLSHNGFEQYYQLHAREWEQYAMVKARVITGSQADKTYLASILTPFVYRKYHDYRIFEELAALKDKISGQRTQLRDLHDNIKLGAGGIRDIEFFIQAFQILKGGRNNQLQTTEIYHCFEVLEKQAIIPVKTVQELREAYHYLRELENRIQMLNDQQTHNLPQDSRSQNRLASTLLVSGWHVIEQKQQFYRHQVSRHFNDLFKRDHQSQCHEQQSLDATIDNHLSLESIQALGIQPIAEIQQQLHTFFQAKTWHFMSAKAKQRFTVLLPTLLRALINSQQPIVLLNRLLNLFSSIAGRSVYFEFLHQNRILLRKLCDLFDKSEWIAEEVAQFPMLLEPLIQGGNLHNRFDRNLLADNLRQQLENVGGDTELELDVLRLFKREQTLVIAIAELAEEISTMKASQYLSELADILLDAVYRLSRIEIEKRYGQPQYKDYGKVKRADFTLIGYGKLGGREMHYQSDLDVIFLYDSGVDAQHSSGPKILDNGLYFARLAQKIISMVSLLTGAGKLYEIDARLRPAGNAGLLVSSMQSYQKYQFEKAWTWEHQALIRARLVAGSVKLGKRFSSLRQQVLCQQRDARKLALDIMAMRDKIYRHKKPPEGQFKNLKHSRGGLMDIEFMVQYWVLSHANKIGSICSYSDNINLLNELIRLRVIPRSQSQLIDIYLSYHNYLHKAVLQNKTADIECHKIAAEVTQVLKSWEACFRL